MNTNRHELLHKELSYQIQGAAIEVRKNFGPGLKEMIYQNAFSEELKSRSLQFEKEKSIKIFSPKTGKFLGSYRPDFIIDNKILVELKAVEKIPKLFIDQLYSYLRNSEYELGYFINFSSPRLYTKRIIFTNDRKSFLNTAKRTVIGFSCLLVSLFVFFSVSPAYAASLYFSVPKDVVFVGEDFEVSLMVDPEGELVNAIGGKITVPRDTFLLRDVHTGDSIIDLWIESPEEENGVVAFSGIIPGGFDGIREPFTPQNAPGKILTLSVRAHAPGTAVFSLADVALLANDGKGTPIIPEMKPGRVVVQKEMSGSQEVNDNIPDTRYPIPYTNDTTPPEPFEVTVLRDLALYDNQWTAIFATQDKESGVDYYEVAEHRGTETQNYRELEWARAKSPHLLVDQERGSHIYVKAVDNSGNIRVARVASTSLFSPSVDKSALVLAVLGIIITLLLIIYFKRK